MWLSLEITVTSRRGVDGQFYPNFQMFLADYNRIDYADHYILAALIGVPTAFINGNTNFTCKTFIGWNRKDPKKFYN
jgi:hypothetical protein